MNLKNSKSALSRKKEREIFIKTYDQYIDHIYRFIYFKVGDKEEAQDLTSAVFLKTWEYVQRNRIKPKTLKALIYKVARNTVIDFYRKKSIQGNIGGLENAINIADEKQDAQKNVGLKLDLVLVEEKLIELKDEYREVIILRFTEEFSISEIANILEKSKGNTRVLIYRALKALREIMHNSNTTN